MPITAMRRDLEVEQAVDYLLDHMDDIVESPEVLEMKRVELDVIKETIWITGGRSLTVQTRNTTRPHIVSPGGQEEHPNESTRLWDGKEELTDIICTK